MTSITRQNSVEIDLLSVDGLTDVHVTSFVGSTTDWETKVKDPKLMRDATPPTASAVSKHEGVGGGPLHIERNAQLGVTVSNPSKNSMKVDDRGIFARFYLVVSAKNRAALEKIRDKEVEVLVIQVVRGVYIARYYKANKTGDCGLNLRTEFIHNAEGVVDRAGSLIADTPAYDKYCTKLCKVGDLLKGKKLKVTLRFYDHPYDKASIKQKWNSQIIEKAKAAINDQSRVQYDPNEESTLCSFEKFVPFSTWLAIRDPDTNEVYPKFCFDWVSQYKITEVDGQYIHSLVCPPENIPKGIQQLPLFEHFRKKSLALVHKEPDVPDLPEKVVEKCQTVVANKYTTPSIFYNNLPVHGANYNEGSFPLVDSDYDKEEESGKLIVVAEEWEDE
ncbi:uncharacterized protein [Oscarella lobularis]|uniref:uncharacterized protein n=1 Tax=Oscarella lobularis TaxID=121494 RepID=UPI003313155D